MPAASRLCIVAAVALVVLNLGSAPPVLAASVTWTGADGSRWSDAASWSPGPPAAGDDVVFPPVDPEGAEAILDVDDVTLGSLAMNGAWDLTDDGDEGLVIERSLTSDLSAQEPVGEGHEVLVRLPITFTGPASVANDDAGGILTLRAAITAPGLTIAGPGPVLMQRSNDIGDLVVDGASGGRVDFSAPGGAPTGSLVVQDGAAVGFGDGTFDVPISVSGIGTDPPDAGSWAPGALRITTNGQDTQPTFAGTVTLTGPATFSTSRAEPTSSLTFTGRVAGPYPLVLAGAGTLALDGVVDVPTIDVEVANLVITGTVSSALTIGANTVVSGDGVVTGPLTVASGGVLDVGAGQLAVGGLDVRAGATLRVIAAGSSVRAAGAVTLAGALQLDPPTAPVAPDVAVPLIVNDGSAAVSGTFAGLPEGAELTTSDGSIWHITYVGGDGNDVEITRVEATGETTTTTTTPTTTTTSTTTTTTTTVTATTTAPTTTTASSTTSVEPAVATTTGASTTIAVAQPATTAVASDPAAPGGALPATGSGHRLVRWSAWAALVGVLLVVIARRRRGPSPHRP